MDYPFHYNFNLCARIALSVLTMIILALPCRSAPPAAPGGDNGILAEANRQASHYAYPEAEKLYQKYLSLHGQNPEAHHMYGRMLALESRWEEALHEYRTALKLKPNDASILNDTGVALSINSYQALGARFLNQAAHYGRLYPGALNNLGVVLNDLQAYKQACDSFSQSLAIQPRNIKIKELLEKTRAKIAESVTFDFGLPVGFEDIPQVLQKMEQAIPDTATAPPATTAATDITVKRPVLPTKKVETPKKAMDESDRNFLEKSQPLFLELKTSGFATLSLSGNGMVQVGDQSDSADNMGEVDLHQHPRVEIMGDVTVDLTGTGELLLGKARITARGDDCIFSLNAESSELSCYAGDFKVTDWNAVTATRTSARVSVTVDNCQSVYGQDDSKIEANNCNEVTLVGHSQGLITKCKKVIINDNASAVARDCAELTALANARVRASGCAKMEKLDRARIEEANN